jgi:phosphoglycerate kinase
MTPLDDVPLLRDTPVAAGSRWIYSAGFNVAPQSRSLGRITAEVEDLAWLADAGARVAVLSHQGGGPQSASHLNHVARQLGELLRRPVGYLHTAVGPLARHVAESMRPGEVTLFGNTRHQAGEQRNDPALAARFAALGDAVAVGGFSKAHRSHASNVGILEALPGFAASSLVEEVEKLAPWASPSGRRYAVAVLGGVKPEKAEIGLAHLVDRYDLVVVGGMVLNAVLKALGAPIGRSELGSAPARCVAAARAALSRPRRAELHIAERVVVAPWPGRGGGPVRLVTVGHEIGPDEMIVDFVPEPWLRDRLDRLARERGRALLAGPPARYREGFRDSTDTLLRALAAPGVDTLLVGGDTVAELPWSGPASTGGGSALTLLATGSCAVIDALRRSARAAHGTVPAVMKNVTA